MQVNKYLLFLFIKANKFTHTNSSLVKRFLIIWPLKWNEQKRKSKLLTTNNLWSLVYINFGRRRWLFNLFVYCLWFVYFAILSLTKSFFFFLIFVKHFECRKIVKKMCVNLREQSYELIAHSSLLEIEARWKHLNVAICLKLKFFYKTIFL